MNRRSPIVAVAILALVLAACAADPAGVDPTPPAGTDAPPAQTAGPTATAPPSPGADPTDTDAATTPSPAEMPDDPLLAVELVDVRSGEPFTLWELAEAEGPVLLQPMAIWCSSCRAQQHEVKRAHETGAGFTSVSIDVDLSELPEDLARYATDQGWDWRFAMADAALWRLLQERFGPGVTNPPSTPLIVVEADGTVRPLDFGVGVRSAERLLVELEAG